MPEKTRKRKQIKLQDAKKTTQIEEVTSLPRAQFFTPLLSTNLVQYPKSICTYTEKQLDEMRIISSSLVLFDAYTYALEKQQAKLIKFLKDSSCHVNDIFRNAFNKFRKKIQAMKQEKIQSMEVSQIQYVKPDRQLFNICKSQKLKEILTHFYLDQQKLNSLFFQQQSYQQRIRLIHQVISDRSKNVQETQVFLHFKPIEEKIVQENEEKVSKIARKIKQNMLKIVSVQQKVLALHRKNIIASLEEKKKLKKKLRGEYEEKWKENPRLFFIEDYFT